MAEEVQNLVVKMTPEGIQGVKEDMEDQQDTFEETTDTVQEQSGILSDFAQQWRGAASVIVAGLTTVAAGLLSQIPVIGEAFSALQILFREFVLLLDEQLRPAISPLTNEIIGLADTLRELDGPAGKIVDTLALFVAVASIVTVVVGGLALGLLGIVAAAGAAGIALGTLALAAVGIVAAIGLISAAITALVVAWSENWFKIREITALVGEGIVALIQGNFGRAFAIGQELLALFVQQFVGLAIDLVAEVIQVFALFAARVESTFDALFSLLINAAKGFANTIVGIIETAVNQAIAAIPDEIQSRLGISGGVNIGRPFDPQSREQVLAGARERAAGRRGRARAGARETEQRLQRQLSALIAAIQNQSVEIETSLDSQQVAEETRQFSDAETSDRGRTR